MTELFKEIIENATGDLLKAVNRQFGLGCSSTSKNDLVREFLPAFSRDLPLILKEMEKSERDCLAEAAYGDRTIHGDRFLAKYGIKCPFPRFHRAARSTRPAWFCGCFSSVNGMKSPSCRKRSPGS